MKFADISKLIGIAVIFLTVSCKKEAKDLALPYRKAVPVVLGSHVSAYDLREILFTLDIAVFKGDNETNEIQELTGLPDSSFKFTDYLTSDLSSNSWVRHKIEKIDYTDTIHQRTFSTMILIDQSAGPENFDSTDYYNQRFQAFNAFYKTLNGQGKVIFSSYNRSEKDHKVVLNIINKEFSDNWDAATAKELLDLTHQQSGTSGLFDALEQAIDYISAINTENKSITLFVRNKDDGYSNSSLDNIISLAKSKNVKINIIWLIRQTSNVDLPSLRRLSSGTGGFSVYMGSIYQSTSVFLGLSRLLKLETGFYRIHVKMTIEEPNWFASRYSTGIYLYYYMDGYDRWNYSPFVLEKPY
jgi:hypothetical protein